MRVAAPGRAQEHVSSLVQSRVVNPSPNRCTVCECVWGSEVGAQFQVAGARGRQCSRRTVQQIAAEFGVSRPTVYRHLGKGSKHAPSVGKAETCGAPEAHGVEPGKSIKGFGHKSSTPYDEIKINARAPLCRSAPGRRTARHPNHQTGMRSPAQPGPRDRIPGGPVVRGSDRTTAPVGATRRERLVRPRIRRSCGSRFALEGLVWGRGAKVWMRTLIVAGCLSTLTGNRSLRRRRTRPRSSTRSEAGRGPSWFGVQIPPRWRRSPG